MLRAILGILAALLNVLPRLLAEHREQARHDAAQRERAAKDARNAAALKAAQEGIDRPK